MGLYMVKNVNRTARLQWKVDTIKKCIYLQCGQYPDARSYQNAPYRMVVEGIIPLMENSIPA